MKKTALTIVFAVCLILCGCTDGQSFSASFVCGEADEYAVCGDGLFAAESGEAKLFDGGGHVVFEHELEVGKAHTARNAFLAAAYVDGGTSIVFSDGGSIRTENAVICADLSDSGELAVCTRQPGYMGSVTVYSAEKKAVYKWYSADGRLISASVSPDGEYLAALTDEGVHLFSLDSESERGMFRKEGLRGAVWLGGRVCCIGTDEIFVCGDGGKAEGTFKLKAGTTGKFGVLDRKLIIEVREHSFGGAGEVYILDDDLRLKNRISPDGELIYLDCRGWEIAILTQNGVSVYSASAKLLLSGKTPGAKETLLTDTGDVLAVGGGSAWVTEK